MGSESLIPMPPVEWRLMVSTPEPDYFDNPNGVPIIASVPLAMPAPANALKYVVCMR